MGLMPLTLLISLPRWLISTILALVCELLLAPFVAAYIAWRTCHDRQDTFDSITGLLRWFVTLDNGPDGDDGWKSEHFVSLNATDYGFKRFLKRWLWIGVRNRAYGLSQGPLSAELTSDYYAYYGDPTIENRPVGKSGWFFACTPATFCWYSIHRWGQSDRCLRVHLGWKSKTIAEQLERLKPALPSEPIKTRAMLVLSPNPLMGFIEPGK